MRKLLSTSLASTVLAATLVFAAAPVSAQEAPGVLTADRETEAVVLTGAQLPAWSTVAARGVANPQPSGAGEPNPFGDQVRDAHNGTLVVPPAQVQATGVNPDQIVAYRYEGDRFVEIPFQVDERFPYFLANGRSDFAWYSGTDEELSYEWDVESWRKTAGECNASYPNPNDTATQDPVLTLDDDDEIAFMASDAGVQAPLQATGPVGSGTDRQEIRLTDPLDPTSTRYEYLFRKEGGPRFTAENGYIDYERDANADEYIDQKSFTDDSFEKLGSSNTGYGPNLPGTVCTDRWVNDIDGNPQTHDPGFVPGPFQSNDRFPRDGITVTTDAYKFRATGRWMIRGMQVAKPDGSGFGEDLIDRWKGRAFQQSPDSSVSVVGFEDEQVNWEGNSALLGELRGPVRAIREVWGADSGTNVTKTETFYRDAIQYRYRVRVHPIPPDGLYTSWDYNARVADTYYNELKTEGVAVDGQNDDIGQIDETPDEVPVAGGQPAFFDVNDPTFNKPLSFLNWEQVSGKDDNGSLVYIFQMNNAQSLGNPLVVPYYRDDACLDDGTGDDPSPRPWPGEAHSDGRLAEYMQRPCYGDPANNTADNTYSKDSPNGFRQGCFACHGIHYFVTGDTDNTFSPAKTTEIDGSQWQWAAPTAQPTNVGDRYANTVKVPLVPVVSYYPLSVPGEMTPTSIEHTGDTQGQVSDTTTLAARLSEPTGPMEGRELVFAIGGEEVGRDITDANGEASVQTVLAPPARDTQLTVSYAGEDGYSVSSSTTPYRVDLDDSALAFTFTNKGKSSSATATLTDADSGSGLSGRTIHFFVGDNEVATGVTDASGVAKATFSMPKRATAHGSFQGDDSYKASTSE